MEAAQRRLGCREAGELLETFLAKGRMGLSPFPT
uniref:Uncharacterized protein n=1 Tax=Setaria italica TaxID=4555 RepID=K3YNV4_SETIT